MKLLKPIEFITNTGCDDLDKYIDYLIEVKNNLGDALSEAQEMCLDREILDDINAQLREILNILSIVENYLDKTVLASIDNLCLEELQSYMKAEKASRENEIQEIERKLAELHNKIELLREALEKDRMQDKTFEDNFKTEDAHAFFNFDIPRELLEHLMDSSVTADMIENYISNVLEKVFRDNSSGTHPFNLSKLVSDATKRIEKARNIVRYSPNAKESVLDRLLESDELKPFVEISSDQKISVDIIGELLILLKSDNAFFKGLDETIKRELISGNFICDTYKSLKEIYEMISLGVSLPSKVERQRQQDEIDTLSEEWTITNRYLNNLRRSMGRFINFYNDENAMRDRLKGMIRHAISEDTTLTDIQAAISKYYSNRESLETELQEISCDIAVRKHNIDKAKSLLEDPHYERLFELSEKRSVARLLKAFGVNYHASSVQSIVDAEIKRLKQIEWMSDLQEQLEMVEGKITNHITNSGFFTKLTSGYKDTLKDLEVEYSSVIDKKLVEVRSEDLLHINAPKYGFTSNLQDNMPLPQVETVMVSSFYDVFSVEHVFWDFGTPFTREVCDEISQNLFGKEWSYVTETLMPLQRTWIKKLWSYKEAEKGHYKFELSSDERNDLLSLQRKIIALAEEVQNEQERYGYTLDGALKAFEDGSYYGELEELKKLNVTEVSKKGIDELIRSLEIAIKMDERYLLSHRSLCEDFGIAVPENNDDEEVEDVSVDLNAPIKALNIPGIETVNEARNYEELLQSLEQFTVSNDTVKRFYLDRVERM